MLDPIPTTVTTLFGETIAATISGLTPHSWTADANGQFHTATDLGAEWKGLYQQLMAGTALSAIQHLEANAEAVFENTKLATLSAADQARDREDAQREFDAIAAAMTALHIGAQPLTTHDYLAIGRYVQSDASLQELSIQGHGLNAPPSAKYNGYTNDFQNGVDGTTLYVGGGLDNNQNALRDFFDDVVISHLPYPVVAQNGHLEQLNQNAASEDLLANSTGALDDAMYWRVFLPKDFSTTANALTEVPTQPPAYTVTLGAGQQASLFLDAVPTTITVNTGLTAAHIWVADSSGLYHTSSDLAAEWKGYYATMLAGKADTLSAIQRDEGNAEAVFENTGLAKLTAAQLKVDREDVQRELDAVAMAAVASGWDAHSLLTVSSYRALEHTLQDNATWLELALQGHGLNSPPDARYKGYTNDFQNNVDQKTLFVGGGQDSGERAIADFLDDAIMTHLPFPTVAQNGEIVQLNQNGARESTVQAAVELINQAWLGQVLKASDFQIPGNALNGTSAPAGEQYTLFGDLIGNTIVANGHTWVAGADGLFHTTTDLAAEWKGYYATMLAGKGDTLTAIQRWEGNAEAAFEDTALVTQKAANLVRDREDVEREIDATAVVMAQLGLTHNTLLTSDDYLHIENALENNAALRELAIQGHGLNSPPSDRYRGYTNDFQNGVDGVTYFVGGGSDNGQNALTDFFDDQIMTHMPYPTIAQNGHLEQLNQNANAEDQIAVSLAEMNATLYQRVYVASDFGVNPKAVGAVVYVPNAPTVAPALPTPGAGQMTTLFGDIISTTQVLNGHTWVAGADGLFHTSTDLTLEWYNLYQQALAGAKLTGIQMLEADAEAVFLNTGLNLQNEQVQERDREDFQRELDSIATAMGRLGISASAPLTAASYQQIDRLLNTDAALHEIALQGHGLNSPPNARYDGYTNDFQNNVDQKTLYVGGGQDTGERAIADLFDDNLMSHLLFPVVVQNGELVQLNQNGNAESTLRQAVDGLNQTMFGKVLTAADFLIPGGAPKPAAAAPAPATITDLYGNVLPGTIVENGHTWVADSTGLYHTTANLEIEWRSAYQAMLAGKGATLTAIQRLEGNAEAIFENTLLSGGPDWLPQSYEIKYREDVQRELDAIAEAMKIDQATLGISSSAVLTEATYMDLAHTLQGTPVLAELALQGHGFTSPTATRYYGMVNDQNLWGQPVDAATLYVGGGPDTNKAAVKVLLDDAILSQLLFPVVYQGGQLWQQNEKGGTQASLSDAVVALDDAMFFHTFKASDFSKTASSANAGYVSPAQAVVDAALAAPAPAGSFKGLYGEADANTLVVNTGLTAAHSWVAGADGLFHTATNLGAEWSGYYQTMLAGHGDTLTAVQRLEGNAEAVFEATGLAALYSGKAALAQQWREDVQRTIDAMALAMKQDQALFGTNPNAALTQASYLQLEHTLQSHDAWEELWMQGHGLAGGAGRYAGYLNDFSKLDGKTQSLVNYTNALAKFFDDYVVGNLGFEVQMRAWDMGQLDENGQIRTSLATAIADLNTSMGGRVYKRSDFH